ncbi:hypothetical protein VTO73DRAFT_5640 [Trametes versicolor]
MPARLTHLQACAHLHAQFPHQHARLLRQMSCQWNAVSGGKPTPRAVRSSQPALKATVSLWKVHVDMIPQSASRVHLVRDSRRSGARTP